MKQDKLVQMARVTEAVYLNEFQKVKSILNEEARLRGELARLQAQEETGRQEMADGLTMQAVGADLLWQAWLSRSRQQLNIELAQVIARKLNAISKVRQAFGRQNAVNAMHDKLRADRQAERQKRAFDALLRNQQIQ